MSLFHKMRRRYIPVADRPVSIKNEVHECVACGYKMCYYSEWEDHLVDENHLRFKHLEQFICGSCEIVCVGEDELFSHLTSSYHLQQTEGEPYIVRFLACGRYLAIECDPIACTIVHVRGVTGWGPAFHTAMLRKTGRSESE